MSDLIKRQDAINFMREYRYTNISSEKIISMIPSAEKTGEWIYDELKGWCCSECGNQAPFWCLATTQNLTGYCPNCGTRMVNVDE